MKKQTGRIKKWFKERSYGFLLDKNNNIRFFHLSSVKEPDRSKLKEGMYVDFVPAENHKGKTAIRINKSNSLLNTKSIVINGNKIKFSSICNYYTEIRTKMVDSNKRTKIQDGIEAAQVALYLLGYNTIDDNEEDKIEEKYITLLIKLYDGRSFLFRSDEKNIGNDGKKLDLEKVEEEIDTFFE